MEKLARMKYKEFEWEHNPRTYTIDYAREMAVNKLPFGQFVLQDLGPTRRMMRGEGEFTGEGAYKKFKDLASVFYSRGPGTLVHPVWQVAQAYFVALSLREEPRADYVSYRFEFWECFEEFNGGLKPVTAANAGDSSGAPQGGGASAQFYTVVQGDCLWNIARRHGIAFGEIIRLNPQLKTPSLIHPGERVRLR
ncbi:MAG: LysM peptidoglycan-binding domain-containing protein [Pseudoflavonifractor sp.]